MEGVTAVAHKQKSLATQFKFFPLRLMAYFNFEHFAAHCSSLILVKSGRNISVITAFLCSIWVYNFLLLLW